MRDETRGALEAIERILNRGGDADDVLRAVVAVLPERISSVDWAGIFFLEAGELVLGPERGEPDPARRARAEVTFGGSRVADLAVDGEVDGAFLQRVALLISPYCLVGWDTAGEPWG